MRLKVRSPRRHHPVAPRRGGRVAGALLLILLLFNLAHLQARPTEAALQEVHALGACACCDKAPAAPLATSEEDGCCSSSAPPGHPVVDACCAADGPPAVHAVHAAPSAPVDDAGCCAEGHGSCPCRQASPGLSAWVPRPLPLPSPPNLAEHLVAPVLSQLEGHLSPPEQPPRA